MVFNFFKQQINIPQELPVVGWKAYKQWKLYPKILTGTLLFHLNILLALLDIQVWHFQVSLYKIFLTFFIEVGMHFPLDLLM